MKARKLRYILFYFIVLNMDFKWLALLSFVVHLWPKLNIINQYNTGHGAYAPKTISGAVIIIMIIY